MATTLQHLLLGRGNYRKDCAMDRGRSHSMANKLDAQAQGSVSRGNLGLLVDA